MWVLRFLTAVLGLLGRGGSPAMMLNLTVPRSGYRVRRGLAYGKAPRQRFDLYLPKVLTTPAPIVLFFYGGAGPPAPAARASPAPARPTRHRGDHQPGPPPHSPPCIRTARPPSLPSHRHRAGHDDQHSAA